MKNRVEYEKNKRFVNPYNFIPLMESCERSLPMKSCERSLPEIKKEDNYTGYFDCRIKLLTPLFVPNTSSSTRLLKEEEKQDGKYLEKGWKGYDFFSYDDWSRETLQDDKLPPSDPVIPGSELRGAVRSVYEAAFNGCMSSISADRALTRRTNEPKKPGLLKWENGKWVIHPCKKAMLYVKRKNQSYSNKYMGIPVPEDKYEKWEEGQEIWIKRKGNYIKDNQPIGELIGKYEIIENSKVSKCNEEEEKGKAREKLRKRKFVQGWLHKGESFSRKHHESVFYHCDKCNEEPKSVLHLSDIDGLKKILEEYRDPRKNRAQKVNGWYSGYEISPGGTLVYYSEIGNDHVQLSPACIGREASGKTISELLENNGGYEPCSDGQLCPACQIFGMIGKSEKKVTYAYGSKVRVTDARLIPSVGDREELFEEPIILPELGEPKPSAVEFYTKPPYSSSEKPAKGNGFWTYDYKHGKGTKQKQFLSGKLPELRGRKYYWHSDVKLGKYRETKENRVSGMKQRIRPMKAGALDAPPLFHFRIYFEQLNKEQLSQLKWALDFGNAKCAHKIGRAKPLGFGSVRIIVDSLNLRNIDIETGSWEIKSVNLGEFLTDPVKENKARKALRQMAHWSEKPRNVHYPSVEMAGGGNRPNSVASHQWFAGNRGRMSNPNFSKILPEVEVDAMRVLDQNNKEKALYTLIKKKQVK